LRVKQNTVDVQRWIARKFSRRQMHLREPVSVTASFRGQIGARCGFGQVTLSAAPSRTFSFASRVTWPASSNYEECILDAILDVLVSSDFHPICGVKFTLEEIGWDEHDSVPAGYYFAARDATRKILRLDEENKNFESQKDVR
jgi:hypothetical protein